MAESPEEKEALEKLDEATREVAWQEEQKEADRELSAPMPSLSPWRIRVGPLGWFFGRFRPFRWVKGDPLPEPVDDPDPADRRGLRDVLDDDPKT
jgi:hypothetical protein